MGSCAILLIFCALKMKNRGKTTAHDYGFIISASHDPVSVFFFEENSPMMTEKLERGDRVCLTGAGRYKQITGWFLMEIFGVYGGPQRV